MKKNTFYQKAEKLWASTAKQTLKGWTSRIVEVLDIPDFDERAFFVNNFRYILLCVALAAIYIANARYAERQMRQMNTIQRELKELRWQYMSNASELMYKSKQTEIAKSVQHLGLEELRQPPKKIIVKE
jgi:hypothetical protein